MCVHVHSFAVKSLVCHGVTLCTRAGDRLSECVCVCALCRASSCYKNHRTQWVKLQAG